LILETLLAEQAAQRNPSQALEARNPEGLPK
jgi:hypothetical protein